MPSYNFVCPECGATFIVVQALSADIPKPKCKVCKIELIRVFGIQTIKFNGTGWGKDA